MYIDGIGVFRGGLVYDILGFGLGLVYIDGNVLMDNSPPLPFSLHTLFKRGSQGMYMIAFFFIPFHSNIPAQARVVPIPRLFHILCYRDDTV